MSSRKTKTKTNRKTKCRRTKASTYTNAPMLTELWADPEKVAAAAAWRLQNPKAELNVKRLLTDGLEGVNEVSAPVMGTKWADGRTPFTQTITMTVGTVQVVGVINLCRVAGAPVREWVTFGEMFVSADYVPDVECAIDWRSAEGLAMRAKVALSALSRGRDPEGLYNMDDDYSLDLDGAAFVLYGATEDGEERPATALGDQILATAAAQGHDWETGRFTFSEVFERAYGKKRWRIEGTCDHTGGYVPVTSVVVASMTALVEG